jgi:hypothetical protein
MIGWHLTRSLLVPAPCYLLGLNPADDSLVQCRLLGWILCLGLSLVLHALAFHSILGLGPVTLDVTPAVALTCCPFVPRDEMGLAGLVDVTICLSRYRCRMIVLGANVRLLHPWLVVR